MKIKITEISSKDRKINFKKFELPKIDFSWDSIEYIEPSEEDQKRLEEYNKMLAEIRSQKSKRTSKSIENEH